MIASELINVLHWAIYIGSFVAPLSLFTSYRKWGATWIAVLFLSQLIFNGCIVVQWENFYRVKEGLAPLQNSLLTDRFSSNIVMQQIVSFTLVVIAIGIIYEKKNK